MADVLVFQSASWPADRADDPEGTEDSWGRALLLQILRGVSGRHFVMEGEPTLEGPGYTVNLTVDGTDVSAHLTWLPAPPGFSRDVWTLQVVRSGQWIRRVVEWLSRRPDQTVEATLIAIHEYLSRRPREFSEIQLCSWPELGVAVLGGHS